MIVAIASVLNEADIIGKTISHLYGEGVDRIVVSDGGSTDGTWEKLLLGVDHPMSQEGPFDQGAEMTKLAHFAAYLGATWIIPFDADEFWIDPLGGTISDILNAQPPDIARIHAATFVHMDLATRATVPKTWGKTCFRPHPDMEIFWGSHHVFNGPGESAHGLLEIRELQYSSFEHYRAKIAKARALFESWDVPMEYGSHMRQLVALSPHDLADAYQAWIDVPTTIDPIDYRGTIPWT